MRKQQIESWALGIIDQVSRNAPHEDSRVELKQKWPDAKKAARRIAAHANSSRGDSVLWIIGVDEKSGVTGVDHSELATWWQGVTSEFEGVHPSLQDINIPVGEFMVVALLFETDRAPFVVKNPGFGTSGVVVSHEVPWREGTAIRSARRADLLMLLAPTIEKPDIEIVGLVVGSRSLLDGVPGHQTDAAWSFNVKLYVAPSAEQRISIPFHRCSASVNGGSDQDAVPFPNLTSSLSRTWVRRSTLGGGSEPEFLHAIRANSSTVIAEEPGFISFSADTLADLAITQKLVGQEISFSIRLGIVGLSDQLCLSASLPPAETDRLRSGVLGAWFRNAKLGEFGVATE